MCRYARACILGFRDRVWVRGQLRAGPMVCSPPRMRNKLTIMAASLPDTPPLEFIEAAMAAGYDGIGLRLHASPAFPNWHNWLDNAPLMRDVKRALTGSGLEMNEILSYYITPDVDLDAMATSLDYGAQLGATYAWLTSRDEDWQRQCDNIGKFCDLAARFDLTVMLGTPVNQLSSIASAFQVIDAVQRPNCVVCVGVGLYLRAGNLADVRGRNRRLLPLIHFNNGTPEPEVAALLDELPMDVILSVESPNRTGAIHGAGVVPRHAGDDAPVPAALSRTPRLSCGLANRRTLSVHGAFVIEGIGESARLPKSESRGRRRLAGWTVDARDRDYDRGPSSIPRDTVLLQGVGPYARSPWTTRRGASGIQILIILLSEPHVSLRLR